MLRQLTLHDALRVFGNPEANIRQHQAAQNATEWHYQILWYLSIRLASFLGTHSNSVNECVHIHDHTLSLSLLCQNKMK